MAMKLSDQQRARLTQLFSTGLKGVHDLLQSLEQEHEALTRGDPESITECVARKQAQMQQVQQNLIDRTRFIRGEFGKLADEGNFTALVKGLETGDLLAEQWQRLQALSIKLREQNDINGNMIALSQQHVRQSIDILTGSTAYDHTYGPRGDRSQERQSHTLAKV
jgi:flagellar biosynthesis/type III secretory pathway chaperone